MAYDPDPVQSEQKTEAFWNVHIRQAICNPIEKKEQHRYQITKIPFAKQFQPVPTSPPRGEGVCTH